MKAMLLSASFGGGHRQAARAIEQALSARGVRDCQESDYLRFVPSWERGPVTWTYAFWLRYWPGAYRWFYHWSNRPNEPKLITEAFAKAGLENIRRILQEASPDMVVASYATASAVIGRARDIEGMKFVNALVVTDLRAHRHWARPEADLIFVAAEETKQDLLSHGLDGSRVHVTGIPILPEYASLPAKETLRRELGFDERPVALMSSGGTGSYRSYKPVLKTVLGLGEPLQLITFDPRDEGMRQEDYGPVRWLRSGYREDFPRWLGAADLVIGKAGGMTASEAMALGVPMVIFDPIPGQEEANADFLQRHGAALWARELEEVRPLLLRLLNDGELRRRMGDSAAALGKPDSAARIAEILLREAQA